MTAEEAASADTYEGYSVVEIVLHVAFCKYVIATSFKKIPVDEYPFFQGVDGFFTPEKLDGESWSRVIDYLEVIHEEAMNSIEMLEREEYGNTIERWGISFKDAAIWLCGHDTYHIAQIRNMGIGALRKGKLPLEVRGIDPDTTRNPAE